MPTHRFPVLLWQDIAGAWTATLAEFEAIAGFGSSDREALKDVKEFLQWKLETSDNAPIPDFHDPALEVHKVLVRPEYRTTGRIHPCEASILLRVACVFGTQQSGQPIASLPLLGVQFSYHEVDERKDLVRRYVLQKLEGCTPEQLACFFPPSVQRLESVVVQIPKKEPAEEGMTPPNILTGVAEALGDRNIRRQYSRAFEREAELAVLVRKLHREKINVLLVGESGVGKTSLLIDAVKEIEREIEAEARKIREVIVLRKFWLTGSGKLIAGMKYLGQWEERIEQLIGALGSIQGVLCADRLLDLVRTGGLGPLDSIAAFLIPYLQRGELRMVAEVTPAELDACRRLLPGLVDLFRIIPVETLTRPRALAILDRICAEVKQNKKLDIEAGTADRILQLWHRFAPYQVFPGRMVDFTRELFEKTVRAHRREVTATDAVNLFMARTGLPEKFLRNEIVLAGDEVREHFRSRIIDQPEACEAATKLVLTFKAGLNDPKRPLGVMLFCGPTGVGKTEMAKAIAEYFFGERKEEGTVSKTDWMIRLDMSEYSGFDAAQRLIGAVGGEPGELIRRMRQQPFTLVLLDEIEKAAPEVFDLLLGVFDEGRLTDHYGKVTIFRSAIIVMTSNLGADKQTSFGFDGIAGGSRPRYRDEAMKFFRPEFFNRLDGVVTFQPLGMSTIRSIVRRELNRISEREGLVRAGLKLIWNESLEEELAKAGFDPKYGARPLLQTLERRIVAPFAAWLLDHPGLHDRSIRVALNEVGEAVFVAVDR